MSKYKERRRIGQMGEHLVCVDLLKRGYEACIAPEGLSYDIVCDIDGKLLRIQVKTESKPIISGNAVVPAYDFDTRKSRTNNIYYDNEVDIVAIVALDTGQVGYVSSTAGRIKIRSDIHAYIHKNRKAFFARHSFKPARNKIKLL